MKIVAISDLHGYLPPADTLPEGDVLCICGDISPLRIQRDTNRCVAWFAGAFLPWTDSLPYKRVIFVGGNHDFFLANLHNNGIERLGIEYGAKEIEDILMPEGLKKTHKVTYLFDSECNVDNVSFYGTPWIADLNRWAFYKNNEDLKAAYDKIPQKVDVLITHMPPRVNDVGTVLQRSLFNSGMNYGSQALADVISTRDIKYSISGHVHTGNHRIEETPSGCRTVNCSTKDENYEPTFSPITFEV